MKLYHGTTERIAHIALTEGLKPRGEGAGNWGDGDDQGKGCPSGPDRVYLTNSYAGYFAGCTADEGELWGIVEVDTNQLDENDLVPDEDFLEQASRNQEMPADLAKLDMRARTLWFRDNIDDFQHHWEASLEGLGNCAHMGRIPAEAITKIAIFDPSGPGVPMMMKAMDPTITLLNYHICGAQYRALTQWLVGYAVPPKELFGLFWDGMPEANRIQAQKIANDTSMIKVIRP